MKLVYLTGGSPEERSRAARVVYAEGDVPILLPFETAESLREAQKQGNLAFSAHKQEALTELDTQLQVAAHSLLVCGNVNDDSEITDVIAAVAKAAVAAKDVRYAAWMKDKLTPALVEAMVYAVRLGPRWACSSCDYEGPYDVSRCPSCRSPVKKQGARL